MIALAASTLGQDAPAAFPSADKPLTKIAFGSCARQDRAQPIWKTLAAAEPELFLFIGDCIYGDSDDPAVLKAKWDALGAIEEFRAFRAKCPMLGVWDDHDYGRNDAGAEYPKKKEAQQLLLDFFYEPPDSPRRKREGLYHAWTFGPEDKRLQIIFLDTRYFRSALKRGERKPDGGRYGPIDTGTMLGDEQWKWLGEQLKTPAKLRIIASSVQVLANEHGWEKWGNMPHERDKLLKLLKEHNVENALFISGDRHFAELSKIEPKDSGLKAPLFDLTSSALNQRNTLPEHGPNQYRVGEVYIEPNFGVISIDWSGKNPKVKLEIRDTEGKTRIDQAFDVVPERK
ncbi:MAG TPA: alkaline phosphatase D family protein [Planctomycetota bacterium]|nr:alkaline phosphatase D family protein [Planctomycetota bacterium]